MRVMEVQQLSSHILGSFSAGVKREAQLSQVFARWLLGHCAGNIVLQKALQVLKSSTFFGVLSPTVGHEIVQRDGQPCGILHPLQHLSIVHTCVCHFSLDDQLLRFQGELIVNLPPWDSLGTTPRIGSFAPCLAEYSLSSINWANPKSAILQINPSIARVFADCRFLWLEFMHSVWAIFTANCCCVHKIWQFQSSSFTFF